MKKITLLIGFICFFIFQSRGEVNIAQFQIRGPYLSGGEFNPNIGIATPFVADIALAQSGLMYNSVKVTIIHKVGSVETALSTPLENSYWGSFQLWQTSISANFPANSPLEGEIYLKVQGFQGTSAGLIVESTRRYSIINLTPPDVEPNITLLNPFSPKYNVVNYGSYDGAPVGPAPFWFPDASVPVISRGQKIYSANGQYVLDFQAYDGNLVLYKVSTGQALWATNKSGGQFLMFHLDGNLIMYNANSTQIIWSSDIYVNNPSPQVKTNAYLRLQDDGDLVLKWDGKTFTDIFGSTGTSGGVYSPRYGKMKI